MTGATHFNQNQPESATPSFPQAIVVMGVSGSGKTTFGKALADACNWVFIEGDDFHSPSNKAKMASGIALDDNDRKPWLDALAAELRRSAAAGTGAVLACSALKASYRQLLQIHPQVRFVLLQANKDLLLTRLQNRKGHFVGDQILDSQLATLEVPDTAFFLDASLPLDVLLGKTLQFIQENT